MAHELSRQALYDLVWSKAKTEVAKGLGVSEMALGKTCKKANVPDPSRGYWAARDAWKRHVRLPLLAAGSTKTNSNDLPAEKLVQRRANRRRADTP